MKFKIVVLSVIGVLLFGVLVYNIFFENVQYVGDLYVSVPVANNKLSKYAVVRESNIKYVSVYKDFAEENNLIMDSNLIIDKYLAGDKEENSYFYADDLLVNIYDSLEYETLYNLTVPTEYQNVMFDYSYVDIWIDGVSNGLVVSAPLVSNVKILYYRNNETVLTEKARVTDIILDVPLDVNNALANIENNTEYNIYPVVKSSKDIADIEINDIIYAIS